MKKYHAIKNEVLNILIENSKTRDSDTALYLEYLKRQGINPMEINVFELCYFVDSGKVASIETISRARRHAQAAYDEVKGNLTVTERRKKECEEYTEYFRSEKR